jgi:hypothetical protein
MADAKLKRAAELAGEFLDTPVGKSVVAKPKVKAKNWVQKLGDKVKSAFASTKAAVVVDPNTARTKQTEDQLYSSGLTPDEVASLRGKKK